MNAESLCNLQQISITLSSLEHILIHNPNKLALPFVPLQYEKF